MRAEPTGLVGFSGQWPKVFHAVRADSDRSLCGALTGLDFFFDFSEVKVFNEDAATDLKPCRACFGEVEGW